MCTFSSNSFYLFLLLFLSVMQCSLPLSCETPFRRYSCDCSLEPGNHSIFFESSNALSDNFVPAMKSLQYCQGSFFCRSNFKQNHHSDLMYADSYLVCFPDDTCLTNSVTPQSMLTRGSVGDNCIAKGCTNTKLLLDFNITNEFLDVDRYKCVKIGQEGIKSHYCLNPVCNSFTAVEKFCRCNFSIQLCSCSTSLPVVSRKTYALFLSFGDIYVTAGAKVNYLQYLILTILCIGSMIVLIVFCNFYHSVDRISIVNEPRNTYHLRRIMMESLDPAPLSSSVATKDQEGCVIVTQGSPPPTYEQVLKDKFSEFKKSVI